MAMAPILIAGPDARSLALTANGLRKDGFEVLSASRGEDALAMLQSAPSLVFCEVGLEGIDGYALCQNLRRAPATRETPFVLLAGRDERALRERARACDADDVLSKPLYLRDLCTLAHLFAGLPRDTATFSGDLERTPLFYVLRALTSGTRSGCLELVDEPAKLHFRDGRIVEATAGELVGEAAIGRLLVLAKGGFVLRLAPVLLRGSISYSLRDLVTCDEPRRRRFERATELMGGPEAYLTVDFGALTRELPRMPASLEQIVRLFDGKLALGEVLRACDLDEVTAAEAVLRLFSIGVLRPAAELPSSAPAVVPPLFEPRPDDALLTMRELFPDPRPNPVEAQPQAAAAHRDWYDEFGQGTELSKILEAGTGGWLELPAERIAEKLGPAVGQLSEDELAHRLAAFDDPDVATLPRTDQASSAPAGATASEPESPSLPTPAAEERATKPEASANASADARPPAAEAEPPPTVAPVAGEPSAAEPDGSGQPSVLEQRDEVGAAVPAGEERGPAAPTLAEPAATADSAQTSVPAEHSERAADPVEPDSAPAAAILAKPAAIAADAAVREHAQATAAVVPEEAFFGSEPDFDADAPAPAPSVLKPVLVVCGCAALAIGAVLLLKPDRRAAGPETRPEKATVLAPAPVAAPPIAEPAVAAPAPTSPPAAAEPGETPSATPAPAVAPAAASPANEAGVQQPLPTTEIDALLAEGQSLFDQGRAVDALVPLEKAATLAPEHSGVQTLLALARLDAGMLDRAAEAARRALALDPGNARAHLVLGSCLQENGQRAKAKAEYQEYLKLAPRGPFAEEVEAILVGMQ